MAGRPRSNNEPTPRRRPATTPEEKENELIILAMAEAKRMLRKGNAPVPIVTHYLRAGSTRDKLEKERLERENELLRAKVDQLASNKRVEELYEKAVNAMKIYSGNSMREDDD